MLQISSEYIDSEFKLSLSSSQLEKINFLKSFFSPYTQRLYIVGGFLRDQLLGIKSDDIDIEVYDIPKNLFHDLMKQLHTDDKGASFFVYRWENIDITLPRIDTKTGKGYFGFKIQLCNDEKTATLRRDFTINALMYDLVNDKLIDFHGGIEDLKNQTLKAVDYPTFCDDSMRIIRGIRLSMMYGFKIEKQTYELMTAKSLDDLKMKRVLTELRKGQWYLSSHLQI